MSDTTFVRGEDPLRADKLNDAFDERVRRTGDTMQGPLTLAADPVNPLDAATKQYIDSTYTVNINASYLLLTGGSMQGNLSLATGPTAPLHAATKEYVDALIASIGGGGGGPGGDVAVTSFNARIGDVILLTADVSAALGYTPYNGTTNVNNYQTGAQVTSALSTYAPIASPIFTGVVSLPANSVGVTPLTADNSTKLATTAYVKANVPAGTVAEITLGPTFPVSPTAGNLHWSTLDGDLYIYTGTAWTEATPDTGTGEGGGVAGVTTFNGRPGDVILVNTDVTAALGFSPYSTANPNGYQTASQLSTAVATETSRATTAENLKSPIASPTFTGIPRGPTATVGTETTQLATTAFVIANAGSGATPRDSARILVQWIMGATVANGTFRFFFTAPYGGTITSLDHFSLTGSFTLAVKIEGTNVTGLSAVLVDATETQSTATAARIFTAGQEVTGVVTGATGSPTNALVQLNVTWT